MRSEQEIKVELVALKKIQLGVTSQSHPGFGAGAPLLIHMQIMLLEGALDPEIRLTPDCIREEFIDYDDNDDLANEVTANVADWLDKTSEYPFSMPPSYDWVEEAIETVQ